MWLIEAANVGGEIVVATTTNRLMTPIVDLSTLVRNISEDLNKCVEGFVDAASLKASVWFAATPTAH